jgi:pullulanase
MLRIHYYRYDQDYTGWDLWIWEKGKAGRAYMFNYNEFFYGDANKIARIAEIDVSQFQSREIGIIVRRGGWHERDLNFDRFITLPEGEFRLPYDVYLVQDTPEIYNSLDQVNLTPGFNIAIFQNFREIFVKVHIPPDKNHDDEPFCVYEDGLMIPVKRVISNRSRREYIIFLENEMKPGSTYAVFKPGYRTGYVDYGIIYDTPEFERLFTYKGDDLGATWTPDYTDFKLWAPTASSVFLNLYTTGTGSSLWDVFEMRRQEQGIWYVRVPGNLSGIYYTYSLLVNGSTREAADPYAWSSGANGRRSMVLDIKKTNPQGWEKISHIKLDSPTEAILYEIHLRDITIHPNSGVKNRGKYLGLTEKDTRSPENMPTALSHLVELGITHVHLMPVFDFYTVDETKPLDNQYNWGYDPLNFNVPEGSYSTDPYDGYVRVKEFKEMIKSFKENHIGVVMDVVYNHTYQTEDSDFNKIVPGYFYRIDRFGAYSNGSGCGNEIASERSMVRKFIIDSVKRWAKEYKIDGFRFDLIGLIDIETMNQVRIELDKISPSILLYGEGWTGGLSLLERRDAATKHNAQKLNKIAFFNDDTRDAIKGDNFHAGATGFITGNYSTKESVKFGVAGAVYHPQIDYSNVSYSGFPWAGYAWHCVNYVASHDNLTLYDKLLASRPDLTDSDHARLVKLASAIVLTSQGIPFITLGTEIMRSKKGEHNSYNLPDHINQIDWSLKARYSHVFDYHKGLILLRKKHPAFNMFMPEDIRRNLTFYPTPDWVIAFSLNNHANNDPWETIFVVYNAGTHPDILKLPKAGRWNIVVNSEQAGTETLDSIQGKSVEVPAMSAMVLYLESETKTLFSYRKT